MLFMKKQAQFHALKACPGEAALNLRKRLL